MAFVSGSWYWREDFRNWRSMMPTKLEILRFQPPGLWKSCTSRNSKNFWGDHSLIEGSCLLWQNTVLDLMNTLERVTLQKGYLFQKVFLNAFNCPKSLLVVVRKWLKEILGMDRRAWNQGTTINCIIQIESLHLEPLYLQHEGSSACISN